MVSFTEEDSSSQSSTSSDESSDISAEIRRRRKVFNMGKKVKFEKEEPKKYLEDEITYTNWQIVLMVSLVLLMGYVIYEYEYVHVCALKFYANIGDKDAQHILAQRYYLGRGVTRNKTLAFYWFKEAAKQGHPHASYNLGVAHIQGFHRLERKGEAHELIKHAAKVGVKEAEHVLKTACSKGECDR